MQYDAILFDLDGVLVSGRETTPGIYRRATASLLTAFGRPEVTTWTDSLQNPDSTTGFREACERFGLPAEAAWAYRERAATQLEIECIDLGVRSPFPDTTSMLLLADYYDIGIVSNNRHDIVAHCVESFEWGDPIDVYRGRYPLLEDFERLKPEPTFLEDVIDRLGVDDPLFIGDRASDITVANRVGADAALLTRPDKTRPTDVDPTYHIESLSELVTLHEAGWKDTQAVAE